MMLEYDSTSAHGLRVPAPELVICSTAEVVYAISMQTLDSRFWASRARRTETIGLKSLSSFIYFYDHCLCDDFRSRTQHSKQTPFRVSNLEAARKSRLILDLILSFIQNLERFSRRTCPLFSYDDFRRQMEDTQSIGCCSESFRSNCGT